MIFLALSFKKALEGRLFTERFYFERAVVQENATKNAKTQTILSPSGRLMTYQAPQNPLAKWASFSKMTFVLNKPVLKGLFGTRHMIEAYDYICNPFRTRHMFEAYLIEAYVIEAYVISFARGGTTSCLHHASYFLPTCKPLSLSHTQTDTDTDTQTHRHARTHARTHARMHARTHACTYARTHARTYARTHTRTYIRTCVRTHMCTHERTHKQCTHKHTHTHLDARASEGVHTHTHTHTR